MVASGTKAIRRLDGALLGAGLIAMAALLGCTEAGRSIVRVDLSLDSGVTIDNARVVVLSKGRVAGKADVMWSAGARSPDDAGTTRR